MWSLVFAAEAAGVTLRGSRDLVETRAARGARWPA
jgi:hypothetical protein